MKKITVTVSDETYKTIAELARRVGTTDDEIIRHAIATLRQVTERPGEAVNRSLPDG